MKGEFEIKMLQIVKRREIEKRLEGVLNTVNQIYRSAKRCSNIC